MRIGLSTGGGDCPGLNAAIRAIVKYAHGQLGHTVIGIKDSFDGLMTKPYGVRELNLQDVTEILNRGGTILGTTNAGDPFAEGSNKQQKILDAIKELSLDALLVIGGDGTQTIAHKFCQLGVPIVGIPKTIDNDLAATDTSIGFMTAVNTATDAISKLQSTAESHERIMVLEVMGRDSGYLALHSGLAGGANVILIPEIPFHYDAVIKKVRERQQLGRYFSIVVVAEGAAEAGAEQTYKQETSAKHTDKNLGGIGAIVATELYKRTSIDTRMTVLGHIQRGGSPCPFDRLIASSLATHAVDLLHNKKFGVVVGYKSGKIVSTPFADIAGKRQPVAQDDEMLVAAKRMGVCLGE